MIDRHGKQWTVGAPIGHYIIGEKMRSGSDEVKAALSRQGRYKLVAGNMRVKEVNLDDAGDRFVICHNPDEAQRDAHVREQLIAQLAAARQGTHSTKTRGQVSGGGAKPYRQKGTGRARQGSTRAPQFAGGGTVFGPTPRDYTQKTPKKMKAAALRGALSDRAREGRVHVVSAFVDGDAPKTKAALKTLDSVTQAKRVLVVLDRDDVLNWVSLRNAPQVHLIEAGQLTWCLPFWEQPLWRWDAMFAA